MSRSTHHNLIDYHSQDKKQGGCSTLLHHYPNAEELILNFLGWAEPNEDEFAQDVRIVLASAEFSKEITSSVMWLNEHGLDISCVRLRPYKLDNRVVVDIQQIIPLPEVAEYQVLIREKTEQQRVARQTGRDYTKYDLKIGSEVYGRLSKRALIYQVVREAIKRGATPEEVANAITWKRIWTSVEGEYKEQEFIEAMKSLSGPRRIHDSQRFFTADDELIHFNGKTYALTNQWGRATLKAVDRIIETIRAVDISYAPST